MTRVHSPKRQLQSPKNILVETKNDVKYRQRENVSVKYQKFFDHLTKEFTGDFVPRPFNVKSKH